MKIVTLAAGVAVGYVLGTRAGREKYEQIVATVRRVSNQPGATTPPSATTAPNAITTPNEEEPVPTAVPRPPRRKPAVPVNGVGTAPLL